MADSGTRFGRPALTRERIVSAAVVALRRDPTVGFSIRGIARELGVAPMAVYRHVRDKEDLAEEVVDQLLAECWEPDCDVQDFPSWVVEAADRLRAFLVAIPLARDTFLRHPVTTPTAVTRMDAMMQSLRCGFTSEALARRAYAAIHTYTLGFAALEASRSEDEIIYESNDLAHELAQFTSSEQFEAGLRCLIIGFGATT